MRDIKPIAVMIETGLRVGEVLALRWEDINLAGRRMYVHSSVVKKKKKKRSYVQEGAKSKSSNRTVPLSLCAIRLLSEQMAITGDREWVFSYAGGDRISYEAMRYQCQRLCAKAQVKYRGLHVWRHTFATNQYYKGTDVKILSKILGHADTSITYNIYIHLYGDGFEDMLRAMD